jgi:biotin transport system substrate-specific component
MKKRTNVKFMALSALFGALLCLCSWISIPAGAVSFTLQTFAVALALLTLGGKWGSCAVLVYLALGAVGLPVFSGFQGGAGALLGATGGYILGFAFAALVMWGMEFLIGRKKGSLLLAFIVGLLVCYGFGTLWFLWVYYSQIDGVGLWTALTLCVFPYVIPDLIKMGLALALGRKISKSRRIM